MANMAMLTMLTPLERGEAEVGRYYSWYEDDEGLEYTYFEP